MKLPRVRSAMHVIPTIAHDYGRYWNQPKRSQIFVSSEKAYMSRATFHRLADYSETIPTGTYDGKMWRSTWKDGTSFLRCYGPHENPDLCSIQEREIVIV